MSAQAVQQDHLVDNPQATRGDLRRMSGFFAITVVFAVHCASMFNHPELTKGYTGDAIVGSGIEGTVGASPGRTRRGLRAADAPVFVTSSPVPERPGVGGRRDSRSMAVTRQRAASREPSVWRPRHHAQLVHRETFDGHLIRVMPAHPTR
jgi:hypothetical protein